MTFPKLAIIGGGQMARALAGGMLAGGVLPESFIHVVDIHPDSQDWWRDHHGEVHVDMDLAAAVQASDVVMLAVKPHIVPVVLNDSACDLAGKLVVSIAAGVSLKSLVQWIAHDRVARVMPNTPSLVGQGASGYCVGAGVRPDDKQHLQTMLSAVGLAVEVTEPQMDAVTGVSGSGPAYVFMVIEAMADGGVAAGLTRDVALQLATQTVLGAATMVKETGIHPAALKDRVCSPGGTTIVAVEHLEQNATRASFIGAVRTAAQHSRQMREA